MLCWNTKKLFLSILLVLLICISCSSSKEISVDEAKNDDIVFEERLLAELPGTINEITVWIQPEGKTVAYREIQNKKYRLVVNGKPAEWFDYVTNVVFSPDGKSLAYSVKQGQQFVTILKDQRIEGRGPLIFSEDGRHWAKILQQNGVFSVMVDQQKSDKGFRYIADLQFIPGSNEIVYWAMKGRNYYLMRKEQEEGPYDCTDWLRFSKDGKILAYTACRGDKRVVVRNTSTIATHDSVEDLVLSKDGKTLVYEAIDAGKSYVMVNGKKGPEFDSIRWLRLAPDGQRVAYIGFRNAAAYAVVDHEVVSQGYHYIHLPVFSPDSRRLAFRACCAEGGKSFVVVDGRHTEPFEWEYSDRIYEDLTFNLNGERVAYSAGPYGKRYIVVDNQKSPIYEWTGQPIFSPDGELIYTVHQNENGKYYLFVNGNMSEPFDRIGPLYFNAAGNKVAFYAVKKNEVWWKVMTLRE